MMQFRCKGHKYGNNSSKEVERQKGETTNWLSSSSENEVTISKFNIRYEEESKDMDRGARDVNTKRLFSIRR